MVDVHVLYVYAEKILAEQDRPGSPFPHNAINNGEAPGGNFVLLRLTEHKF